MWGKLTYNHTWQFKLLGTYQLPWGINMSGIFPRPFRIQLGAVPEPLYDGTG